MSIDRLVLASSNAGKLREFRALFASSGIGIVPQGELGIGDAEEPHATFVENALAKARHASHAARLPAFADDSGIVVAALGGDPGVHSARFAGEPRSDDRNNAKLVADLAGQTDRRAHYYCVIVLVRHPEDPEPVIAEGRWHGTVIDTPRGHGGFGYDPYFLVDGLTQTAAEIDLATKNGMSHRARAAQRLFEVLRDCGDLPSGR